MTNNTIPNVPRELLAELKEHIDCHRDAVLWGKVCALLSAPSPAGVDGLEVVAWATFNKDYKESVQLHYTEREARKRIQFLEFIASCDAEPLCRLSDAQAIIDGLRGENERIRLNIAEYNEAIASYQSERDQQTQRIGELEGLLRHAQKQVPTGSGMHMRIDAALSAGKEGE